MKMFTRAAPVYTIKVFDSDEFPISPGWITNLEFIEYGFVFKYVHATEGHNKISAKGQDI